MSADRSGRTCRALWGMSATGRLREPGMRPCTNASAGRTLTRTKAGSLIRRMISSREVSSINSLRGTESPLQPARKPPYAVPAIAPPADRQGGSGEQDLDVRTGDDGDGLPDQLAVAWIDRDLPLAGLQRPCIPALVSGRGIGAGVLDQDRHLVP